MLSAQWRGVHVKCMTAKGVAAHSGGVKCAGMCTFWVCVHVNAPGLCTSAVKQSGLGKLRDFQTNATWEISWDPCGPRPRTIYGLPSQPTGLLSPTVAPLKPQLVAAGRHGGEESWKSAALLPRGNCISWNALWTERRRCCPLLSMATRCGA